MDNDSFQKEQNMARSARFQTLTDDAFHHLAFIYAGTLISGRNQEIDIYRPCPLPDMPPSAADVEIRVTMTLHAGAMDYSCISLTDSRGAPVILVGLSGRTVNDEMAEVAFWEAIEDEDRALDYTFGRSPLGAGMKPGTFLAAPQAAHDIVLSI